MSIIARRYGISVTELSRMNNKRSTMIHPGEKLIVGHIKMPIEKKTPVQNQTLAKDTPLIVQTLIDTTIKSTKDTLTVKVLNDESNKTESSKYIDYKVQEGDTLWSISQRFQSVSVDDIRKVNNMGTNDRLTVGKTLRIPK